MEKKKLTVMIEGFIYDAFAGKCKANNFKISEVLLAGIAECSTLISLAVAKREHDFREAKEAQILSIAEELEYTDADIKKLLKNSKPAEAKPAKEEKVIESRHAHKGTYEVEDVMWEVDKFNTGYFCRTSDGKTHRKDVNGNIIS